jgi:putative membrane protein
VSAAFLDAAARAAFEQAIAAIEKTSAAEVVVAVRRRSAAYRHANVAVGAAAAFAGLAAMLFGDHVFALTSILIDPFVIGALAGAAVELLPGVKRLLTPGRIRRRAVERAARATFVERRVHGTRGRSGVLVYISWLEREVSLVADVAVAAALSSDAVHRAEHAMTAAMRRGGVAVAHELSQLAAALTAAAPRRAADVNELADAIHSDLDRRDGGEPA